MPLPSQHDFARLPLKQQLGHILFRGTHVATRTEQDEWVRLYTFETYLVEIWYAASLDHVHGCRTFPTYTEAALHGWQSCLPVL